MALGYLSEVERGQKELSSEFLDAIANAYGVSTSSIVIEAGVRLASWELPNSVPENFGKELVVGF
jgi:transcriptional regulator with XRE-family HTH domain